MVTPSSGRASCSLQVGRNPSIKTTVQRGRLMQRSLPAPRKAVNPAVGRGMCAVGFSPGAAVSARHPVAMADPLHPATLDEALGLRALAAVLDSDLDRAARVLAAARRGYRFAFPCRLAVVIPSVALRVAFRLASRP